MGAELAAILVVPAVASVGSLSPLGRRLAAPGTLLTAVIVLSLSINVAIEVAQTGQAVSFDEWLTCDGLAALMLVLVSFVGVMAAIFSWGYIRRRAELLSARKERYYYGLYNLFLLSMLAVPILANIALMWAAVELTTLLSTFLVGFDDTPESLEAAWKYVILTTLGAVVALFGFLLLYWGLRVAGYEPFTWLALLEAAPKIPPSLGSSGRAWPAHDYRMKPCAAAALNPKPKRPC